MSEELENKWREDFIEWNNGSDIAPTFNYGWYSWLAARKKAQEEIQKRDELLNTALKHLDMAYKWGLWLYESEEYQEMEDDDEKDNMKSDLNIVCSFLNTNKGCER